MSSPLRIVVVTGLSGAGKSTALRVLEDLGYFCVDNLPTPLALEFARMAQTRPDIEHVALGVDARGRAFGRGAGDLPGQLKEAGFDVSVLFLDASDETLLRRFSETRRPHPFAAEGGQILGGIATEREASSRLRAQADEVIDTSYLSVHQLRRTLTDRLGRKDEAWKMAIRLMSFGFRYGLPIDADVVVDVRFLPNPYFVPELKHKCGLDAQVSEFVLAQEEASGFLDRFLALLEFLVPLYQREGKSYLTVALGCTGGQHRSVAIAEEVARRLAPLGAGPVLHRDVNRHRGERLASRDSVTT